MKTTIVTTILLISGITFSQNEVVYTYDDAGNRIKREHIPSANLIIANDNNETTAIANQVNSGVDLDAHPNPTSDNTKVMVVIDSETISEEHKTLIESGVNMQLVDISGKVLQTQKGTSLDQTFNLQGMSNGVYFVKVFTSNGELIGERKIVKE